MPGLPWRGRPGRANRRRDHRSFVPGPRQRPVAPHHGDYRTPQPWHAGLPPFWEAHRAPGHLRRGGLVGVASRPTGIAFRRGPGERRNRSTMIEAQEGKRSVSRRNWLVRLGLALNAIAAALVGIPILAFVVHGLTGRKLEDTWIPLGPVTQFPEGETRLATYRNPFTRPWDGETGNIPCW